MKLIIAVVQDTDADDAIAALVEAGYRVTRVASTGGFFRQGNTTLLCGVDDEAVCHVVRLLRHTCQQRTRTVPVAPQSAESPMMIGTYAEVAVGGATLFVMDVEHFEQL